MSHAMPRDVDGVRLRRLRLVLRLAAIGMSLDCAAPAAAQVHAGADAVLASAYVWRGVTRNNGYVLQPDAYLAVDLRGAGWITAGAWADLELERSGIRDLSDRTDGSWGFGERDAWVQVTRTFGVFDVTAGWVGYFHRTSLTAGATDRYDTHEVYAAVQVRPAYLSPRVSAWYDVSRIDGLYLEGSVSVPVMGSYRGRFWALYLTAAAGLNAGQGPDPDHPLAPTNFARDGLTHLDLGAALHLRPLSSRWAATQLEGHLQFNDDPYTKRHGRAVGDAAPDDHLVTAWFGVSVSVPAYQPESEP